jgi:membrane protein required for colicin V production
MNWLDIVLVLTVAVSIISGLAAGFARTGVGFLASVLGLVFGLQYYRSVGLTLRGYIPRSEIANAIGFLIVFCGITAVGSVAAGILARFFRTIDLVWLDRLLGGAFGVVRGILFATITIWALMAFVPAGPTYVLTQSRLAPCVMDAAGVVAAASPEDVRRNFRESYRQLKKVLPENIRDRLGKVPPAQI